MGVYFKEVEVPIYVDGIRIDLYFDDGHIETHIIKEAMHLDLVRCGECKHSSEYDMPQIDPKIEISCDVNLHSVSPNDFCSYGERRTDEKDNM